MVSIIIPAYNSATTIVETLESVKAQTFTDYEVIVVDDCSKDNTLKMVEKWLSVNRCRLSSTPTEDDPNNKGLITNNWRILRLAHNTGPAAARNRGGRVARGEWIAFLDSDDIWLPEKLELQVQLATQYPKVALWCGKAIRFADGEQKSLLGDGFSLFENETNKQQSITSNSLRAITLEDLALRNSISTSTVIVKRETFFAVGGFDEQFRGPEDYDLWLRVAAAGAKVNGYSLSVLEEDAEGVSLSNNQQPIANNPGAGSIVHCAIPVAFLCLRPGSLSMEDRTFLPQVMRVLDKAYGAGGALEAFQHLKRVTISAQYWSGSWMAFSRGARWTAVRLLSKAWRLHGEAGYSVKRPWLRVVTQYLCGRCVIRKNRPEVAGRQYR